MQFTLEELEAMLGWYLLADNEYGLGPEDQAVYQKLEAEIQRLRGHG